MGTRRPLTRHGGTGWLTEAADEHQRQALNNLMRLVDGYPLQMTVTMPQLATPPPAQSSPNCRPGQDTADPSTAARRAIEYSHGKLGPTLQSSLPLLAPSTTCIPTSVLDTYGQRQTEAVTYLQLGMAAQEQRRVRQAEQHYRQALELDEEPARP